MKVPTVEGIHLLYLEINKIFSLSCQPICNSAGWLHCCVQWTNLLVAEKIDLANLKTNDQ
uniref:Uncharacterized protein n=1 Tax=Acinetobacter ursingii TaxID=108980 RepID=A0A499RH81_9GAMM|nr:hypothetical protein [Acinetobacter ursingii]